MFKAGFLVVTSLEHPYNNLGDLQRAKWSPTAASLLGTLDIGWAIAIPLFLLKWAHNHIMNNQSFPLRPGSCMIDCATRRISGRTRVLGPVQLHEFQALLQQAHAYDLERHMMRIRKYCCRPETSLF